MTTIGEAWRASRGRRNRFDEIRLAAAGAVIVSHSFEIVGGPGADEPLRVLTDGQASLGRLAVMAFFALSGFLLAQSWLARPDLRTFAFNRALRIVPALLFVVAASVLVFGPLLTSLPTTDYFAAGGTWRYFANAAFYTKFDSLPGVFVAAPFPNAFNGPLWTLKFEVMCYAALATLGAARLLNLRLAAALLLALTVLHAFAGDAAAGGIRYYLDGFIDLARPFFAGSLLALAGDRIRSDRAAAAACLALLPVSASLGILDATAPLLVAYCLVVYGLAGSGPATARPDLSYGLYVWGWPAQQLAASLVPAGGWFVNAGLGLTGAGLAALLSWRCVEAPALRLKWRPPGVATPVRNPPQEDSAGTFAGQPSMQ